MPGIHSAAYTVRLIMGTTTLSGTGSLTLTPGSQNLPMTITIVRTGSPTPPPLTVTFTLNPVTNLISDGSITDGTSNVAFKGWRSVWSASNPATGFAGNHNFGLDIPASAQGLSVLPQGVGYGFFSEPSNGGVTGVSLKMADGVPYTGSSFMGPNGELAIFQTSTKGSLSGIIDIEPDFVAPNLNIRLGGTLSWLRVPTTDRNYAAGFGPLSLTVIGSRFNPPDLNAVVMGLPNRANNARVTFFDGGIGGPPSRADRLVTLPTGRAIITIAPAGTTVTALTVDPTTGSLTGSFRLSDIDFINSPFPRIDRTVLFEGRIFNDGTAQRGYGFFNLPQMPTQGQPASATPILSGAVILEAN